MDKKTFTAFKLLAYPMRLRMCEVMSKQAMTTEEIAKPLKERGNTILVHINRLRDNELVWSKTRGQQAYHEWDKQRLEEALLDFSKCAGLTLKRKAGTAKKVDRDSWVTGGLLKVSKIKYRKRPSFARSSRHCNSSKMMLHAL